MVALADLPRPSAGAPLPIVMGDETTMLVAYFVSGAEGEAAIVRFEGCLATTFGPPNDEALEGHPLADRGLVPYAAARVQSSSWIRRLCAANEVHDRHDPEPFKRLQHVILTFHDSTFEVACTGYEVHRVASGDRREVIGRMVELL